MSIEEFFDFPFTFTKRKDFTPCDTRPLWKASLIILILGVVGRNNSASLQKIHVANWVVKSAEHLNSILEWQGKEERMRPNVRLEPAIDHVLNFMISNKILEKENGSMCLTELGVEIYQELDQENVFCDEKRFLLESKKYLSEAAVKRIFEGA